MALNPNDKTLTSRGAAGAPATVTKAAAAADTRWGIIKVSGGFDTAAVGHLTIVDEDANVLWQADASEFDLDFVSSPLPCPAGKGFTVTLAGVAGAIATVNVHYATRP